MEARYFFEGRETYATLHSATYHCLSVCSARIRSEIRSCGICGEQSGITFLVSSFSFIYLGNHERCKTIPVTFRGGPQGYEAPRLPHVLDNRLTNGGEFLSLTRWLGRPLLPGWVDPRAIAQLEGLSKLKKSNNLIGNRIHDLSAWSIVPQQLRYRVP
jgi:hypothetical protein